MAEPGWYVDPSDPAMAVWWDGDSWTERQRPLTEFDLPYPDAEEPTDPAEAPDRANPPAPGTQVGRVIVRPRRKLRIGRIALVALVLIVVVGGTVYFTTIRRTPDFRATVSDISVVDPGVVSARLVVKNSGDGAAKPECAVTISNGSGKYSGHDTIFAIGTVQPGASRSLVVRLNINDEGAEFVTDGIADCR